MIIKTILIGVVFLFSGCTFKSVEAGDVGVMTVHYGECIATAPNSLKFHKKQVTFRCDNNRVLLGYSYEKDDKIYMDSGIVVKKENKYQLKEKKAVKVERPLKSLCELAPKKGSGEKKLRRYYFDMGTKMCQPFIWSGKGGFVPFESEDACQQYCNYKFQG